MAIYDNNLDPFGDGSLLESYLFEYSLSNEQGTRTLTDSGGEYGYVDGVLGKARQVGHIDDDESALNGQVDGSVSCWIQNINAGSTVGAGIGNVADYDTGCLAVYIYRDSDTEITVQGDLSYSSFLDHTVTTDPAKEWFFLTITYNVTTGNAKLYLDGVEVDSVVETGLEFNSLTPTWAYGTDYNEVDQLMIWNKELSPSEINSLHTMEAHVKFIDFLIASESKILDTVDFSIASSVKDLEYVDFNIVSDDAIPTYIDFNIVSASHRGELIDFDIVSTNVNDPEFINLNIVSGNIPNDTESPEYYSAQLIRRIL